MSRAVPGSGWALCGVRSGDWSTRPAALGLDESEPLGLPAPTWVGCRGAAPLSLPQWQSSGVRAGGSPAQLKTVLETTAPQH